MLVHRSSLLATAADRRAIRNRFTTSFSTLYSPTIDRDVTYCWNLIRIGRRLFTIYFWYKKIDRVPEKWSELRGKRRDSL